MPRSGDIDLSGSYWSVFILDCPVTACRASSDLHRCWSRGFGLESGCPKGGLAFELQGLVFKVSGFGLQGLWLKI